MPPSSSGCTGEGPPEPPAAGPPVHRLLQPPLAERLTIGGGAPPRRRDAVIVAFGQQDAGKSSTLGIEGTAADSAGILSRWAGPGPARALLRRLPCSCTTTAPLRPRTGCSSRRQTRPPPTARRTLQGCPGGV
jgi:hypothetical protein